MLRGGGAGQAQHHQRGACWLPCATTTTTTTKTAAAAAATATATACARRPASSSSLAPPAAAAAAAAAADPLGASLAEKRAAAEAAGTWKSERVIQGPQGPRVRVGGKELRNFCSNSYLGLSNAPSVVAAAKRALDTHGFGLASVRFICGTTDLHVALEERLAAWLGAEACILFPSGFDANAGVFEALLGPRDAVVSDALNHASIIDGVRLCKARRHRYAHGDVAGLEAALREAASGGGGGDGDGGPSTPAAATTTTTLVVTDGVFSMDGAVAPLERIVPLVRRTPGAYLMVDDCHASGFWGATGRGTAEARGLLGSDSSGGSSSSSSGGGSSSGSSSGSKKNDMGGVDILSSTLGKALGGATGGFVCARADVVAQLRQAARPYLFSNTLAPSVAAATLAVLDVVQGEEGDALRAALRRNAALFRGAMADAGFSLGGGGGGGGGGAGPHPIVPVMLGDAALASEFARRMLERHGVYVVAFSYPVVPKGTARIRVQLSAAHSEADVEACVAAFVAVGREMGVLPPAARG